MLKRILKKKQIKTNKKNQCVLCKILSKKKKTKPNQTNVNILCKPEEILSRQKKKKKKLAIGWRREILSNTHLPHFLSILETLNFGGPKEKKTGPHHLSLHHPLSTKHPSHSFSLLFSTLLFSSSLKSTKPNIPLDFIPKVLFYLHLLFLRSYFPLSAT